MIQVKTSAPPAPFCGYDCAMEILVVLSTFPTLDLARRVATALVGERLAACVNLCPAMESVYRWEGKVETAHEVLAVIKTRADRFDAVKQRICAMHSYELPEVVAVPVTAALEDYVAWVVSSTAPG